MLLLTYWSHQPVKSIQAQIAYKRWRWYALQEEHWKSPDHVQEAALMRYVIFIAVLVAHVSSARGQMTLFADDFNTGFSSGWHNTNGWVALGGKAYCYSADLRSTIYVGEITWFDQVIALDYMPTSGVYGHSPEFEVYLCSQSNSNTSNCYRVDFYQTEMRLNEFVRNGFDNLVTVAHGHTIQFGSWYRIEIMKTGSTIKARIYPKDETPGAWRIMFNDSSFGMGSVAFAGFSTLCYIDNVSIVGQVFDTGPHEYLGHSYQLCHRDQVWESAYLWAREQWWNGKYGHLATLAGSSENAAVAGMFDLTMVQPYLGGYQDHAAFEPRGGWAWCTDEPWTFESWAPGAPNQLTGDEDYLVLTPLGWDDVQSMAPAWYLVEYEEGAVRLESSSWGAVKAMFR